MLYPNNVKHQYTYTALNRLELLIDRNPTNSIINCWRYRATPAGQRTWVEEFDKRTAWYTYDSLGRLKTETVTGSIKDGKNGTVNYSYDNVGNRLSRVSSLAGVTNQSFGYDWNDRLNGDQHDNNGNTKSAPVSQSATINAQQVLGTDDYDSENRLVQPTSANGASVTLVYDGDGNRVAEIVGGQTKAYLVDDRNPTGYAQVVEEIVGGVVNHTYTFGHDLISQDQFDPVTNNWKASFYGYDGRGTVRFLTDETGAVTDTYTYDAFGTLITATGSTNNRYLYSGEQWDPNLGLYYLRARLMNPLTGRFWTQDSYEGSQTDPISLHKYLYASVDPANASDPSGHLTLAEVQIVAMKIGTFALISAPAAQRASVFVMEALSGGNVVLPGLSGTVSAGVRNLRHVNIVGGITTFLRSALGNRSGKTIGTILDLRNVAKAGEQANHLNIKSLYGAIPDRDAVGILLDGQAAVRGTQHWKFHESMEIFLDQFRRVTRAGVRGARAGDLPTNKEYGEAVVKALEAADIDPTTASNLASMAQASRQAYNYLDDAKIPISDMPNPVPGH